MHPVALGGQHGRRMRPSVGDWADGVAGSSGGRLGDDAGEDLVEVP